MTVIEWLRRLNVPQYAETFSKKKIFWLSDLRWFIWEWKDHFPPGMFDPIDNERMMTMLMGNDEKTREDFDLLTM